LLYIHLDCQYSIVDIFLEAKNQLHPANKPKLIEKTRSNGHAITKRSDLKSINS